MVVAIEQASRLDGTVAGDHHAEFHAPWGVAPSSSGNTLQAETTPLPRPVRHSPGAPANGCPSQCRPARAAPGTRRPAAEGHPATPPRRYSAARLGATRHLCGVAGHQFAQAIHLAQHPPTLFVDPQSAGGGFERLGIAVQQCHSEDSSGLCTRRVIATGSGPGSRRPGSGEALRITATKASMSSIFMGPAPIAFLAY